MRSTIIKGCLWIVGSGVCSKMSPRLGRIFSGEGASCGMPRHHLGGGPHTSGVCSGPPSEVAHLDRAVVLPRCATVLLKILSWGCHDGGVLVAGVLYWRTEWGPNKKGHLLAAYPCIPQIWENPRSGCGRDRSVQEKLGPMLEDEGNNGWHWATGASRIIVTRIW